MKPPKNIEKIFFQAKRYYPELDNIFIKLNYTPLTYETMSSRPFIFCFLFPWIKRRYLISINSNKYFGKYSVPIYSFNDSILLGWFGHELAHMTQYEKMNWKQIIKLPFNFLFKKKFRRNFEVEADETTKQRGLEKELQEGLYFILNNSKVNKAYKERMKKYYSQYKKIYEQK